jgi:hypothetical protein
LPAPARPVKAPGLIRRGIAEGGGRLGAGGGLGQGPNHSIVPASTSRNKLSSRAETPIASPPTAVRWAIWGGCLWIAHRHSTGLPKGPMNKPPDHAPSVATGSRLAPRSARASLLDSFDRPSAGPLHPGERVPAIRTEGQPVSGPRSLEGPTLASFGGHDHNQAVGPERPVEGPGHEDFAPATRRRGR